MITDTNQLRHEENQVYNLRQINLVHQMGENCKGSPTREFVFSSKAIFRIAC